MIRQLNESQRIPSSLTKALNKDWAQFIENLEQKIENGESLGVNVEDLIDMFSVAYGRYTYDQLYYTPFNDIFKTIKLLSVDEIMNYYSASRNTLDGHDVTYAVSCAIQRRFAEQHIQELEEYVEEFKFVTDSNREIGNRPNYESLNRRRNRKK